MTTTSLLNNNSYAQNSAGDTGGNQQNKAGTADYQTFIKLMIAQVKNQDPTEPVDATQYVSQLASFSVVEQAVQTNDKLKQFDQKLDELLTNSSINQAGSYVGKYVSNEDGTVAGLVDSVKIYSNGLIATLDNGTELLIGPGVSVRSEAPATSA